MSNSIPNITVSIVLHRTPFHQIESVVGSLSLEPVDMIYFIDNSPDNSLEERIGHLMSNVRYKGLNWQYRHVDNRGYGNAHNIAIGMAVDAHSQYHLVLNADVRWSSPVFKTLVEVLEKNPDCGLLQPKILNPDGTLQHTCRLLPTPYDVFGKRFLPPGLIKNRMRRYLLSDEAYGRRFNAVYMQGSFMFFRMSSLKDTGLFDERFFMYPEDIDITRRIRDGYSALYIPEVSVVHDHAAASSRINRMLWIHIVNMIRYFNKWGWFLDAGRRRLNRELMAELGTNFQKQ